ncbi:MAG: hypothetical protein HKN82_10555 [Akkermansiaceae bacterium]|nr:hypothetical protein [Akkermansiaceae bacterium]
MKASQLYFCLAIVPALWLLVGIFAPANSTATPLPQPSMVEVEVDSAPEIEIVRVVLNDQAIGDLP